MFDGGCIFYYLLISQLPVAEDIKRGFRLFCLHLEDLCSFNALAEIIHTVEKLLFFAPVTHERLSTNQGRASKDESAPLVLKQGIFTVRLFTFRSRSFK